MAREPFIRALLRQNRKGPVTVAVLLLLNLLGWLIVGWILAPGVEEARAALAREQERQRQQLAGEAPLQRGTSFREGRQELERFHQILLTRDELTLFLGEIYTLAQEAGLDIDRISFKPEALGEQGLLRYVLSFSVSGSYSQIKQFVHGFENSDRIMILDKMNLSGEQAGQDRVALGLQLTTYFLADDR